MELFFNSVWVLVAISCLAVWLKLGRRTTADRQMSLVALVLLIVILFPVISVSDDLWSVQNPAEPDTSLRRDHAGSCPHSQFPAIATPPELAIVELSFAVKRLDAAERAPFPAINRPALDPIENRPPPSA